MKTTKCIGLGIALATVLTISCCNEKSYAQTTEVKAAPTETVVANQTPDYFMLRPEVEKAYGYSHAVKIGNAIKVSGAVSMDEQGNPTAVGDLEQQMKNCYADLEKILAHYGCTMSW